jgi:hypothetical protein
MTLANGRIDTKVYILLCTFVITVQCSSSFRLLVAPPSSRQHRSASSSSTVSRWSNKKPGDDDNNSGGDTNDDNGSSSPEYRNLATSVLSNFMGQQQQQQQQAGKKTNQQQETMDPLAAVDFSAQKFKQKLDIDTLARVLDAELYHKEWFVTGQVNAALFSKDFCFQDPDVRIQGIEQYARGVYQLFDQETSRAEIIRTTVTAADKITCTWRLSGRANIGPVGLTIKPYIVYTDFTVDSESGLIVFQEDRFDIPGWDILLSSLFPFLIGKLTAAPAPPVEPRVVTMPKYDK